MEQHELYELGFNPRAPINEPYNVRLIRRFMALGQRPQNILFCLILFSVAMTCLVAAQLIWNVITNFWHWMLLITALICFSWLIFVFAIKFRIAFQVKEQDPIVKVLRRGTRGAMRRINRNKFGVPTNLTHAAEILARHGLKGDRALNEIENRLYRICSTDGVQVFGGVDDTEMLVWYHYPDPNPKPKDDKKKEGNKQVKVRKEENSEFGDELRLNLDPRQDTCGSAWSESSSTMEGSDGSGESRESVEQGPERRVLNVMLARGYVEAAMGYILDKSNVEEFSERWVGRDNTVHVFSHLVGKGVLLGPRSQWWRRVWKAVASVLGLDWARPEL